MGRANSVIRNKYAGRKVTNFNRMVLETYGTVCHICGKPGADTADHILPKALYPELMWEIDNARPAHRKCNSSRGTNPLPVREEAEGWFNELGT